jgi:membrane-associated phospholipid phosphatase
LFDSRNTVIAGIGIAGTVVGHGIDQRIADSNWGDRSLKATFAPGKLSGNFLVQAGGALATWGVGRATTSPKVARIGAEIFRAQVVSQGTAQAIKYVAQRTRPDGSSHSFPSGHAASAFATASVLQSELGWKAGVPAYAAATWIAASRVQTDRHYLSDVIAGATLGILSGRSVTVGHGKGRFSVEPMPLAGGVGVSFTKVP